MPIRLPTLLAGLAIAALATARPLAAQSSTCAAHPIVVEQLADRFGESRQAIGIAANNAVVEIFANPDSGSWTIAVTTPGGLTCLVAAGYAFEHMPYPPRGTDSGA